MCVRASLQGTGWGVPVHLSLSIKMQTVALFFRKSNIEDILSTLCISYPYPWTPGVLMAPRYLSAALTLLLNSNLISFQLPDWQLTLSCHSFKISLPIIPSKDYSSYRPLGLLGHYHPPRLSGLRSQHHFSFPPFVPFTKPWKLLATSLKTPHECLFLFNYNYHKWFQPFHQKPALQQGLPSSTSCRQMHPHLICSLHRVWVRSPKMLPPCHHCLFKALQGRHLTALTPVPSQSTPLSWLGKSWGCCRKSFGFDIIQTWNQKLVRLGPS